MMTISDTDKLFDLVAALTKATWADDALCKGVSDGRFFDPDRTDECLKMCFNCPVRLECLNDALLYGDEGFRGGTTDADRSSIIRRQKRYYPQFKHDVLDVCYSV